MSDPPDWTEGDSSPDTAPAPASSGDFAELRALLLAPEHHELAELRRRLDALGLTADDLAEHLPEAIALRAERDDRLARALAPTLEGAFSESVHRNPHQIAQAIYPTLGPAIRKAIAEAIGGLVTGINRALEESLSVRGLRWRIEAWRSGVPYPQIVMKHALVYRVEQAYLIHGETGLLLAHVTAPDLTAPDADVISGMLTAIRDFVGDSFAPSADGGLRTFSVGDVTVLVEAGPRALLAAVVRGQHPPALLERVQETLELIHLQFAGPLARFDGDGAPFETARPVLAECLETVVDTARTRRRTLVPRVIWMLVLMALLFGGYVAIAAHRRWRGALETLASEPGLVVLSADRGLRGWRITGLHDPLARPSMAVLAGIGVDTSRVRGDWSPYLSADSAVVVRRAERVLAPPATAQLTVVGDTVVASGSAPTDWIDRAQADALRVAGVAAFRAVDLSPHLPESLDSTAGRIAAERVFFLPGSTALSASALTTLRTVAADVGLLASRVGPRWAVSLDVIGRTDTTGSLEGNRMLSDDRARVAVDALARLGVPDAALHPLGLGIREPIAAATAEDHARQNRSVSFAVRLQPAGMRTP